MAGVAVVTGGARGIGRATALLLAEAGFAIAVNYRTRVADAEAVVAAIGRAGGRAAAVPGDVAEEADVERMFAAAEAALGPPTALVNSAGIGSHARAVDIDAATLMRLMAVNVVGTMLCCREAVLRMSTARGGAGGAIVNVSSMAGTIGGRPGASHYAASKAAVDAFTVGLAKEVAAEGIRVNAVRPGVTLTDMTDTVRRDPTVRAAVEATIPMRRAAEPREVAEAIAWLLSEKASFVSGARLDISGGGFVVGAAVR